MGLIEFLKKVPKIPFIAAAWLLLLVNFINYFTYVSPNNNYLIISFVIFLSLFIFQIVYNILHFVRNKPKFNLKKVIVWVLILIFIGVSPVQALIDLGVAFSRPASFSISNKIPTKDQLHVLQQKNQITTTTENPNYEIINCKTYTLPSEKLTFSCPSNWKLKIFKLGATSEGYTPDIVELISPNSFKISINTGAQYDNCDSDCRAHNLKNIVLANKLDYYTKPLYVVVHGLKDYYGHSNTLFSVTTETSCITAFICGYKAKNTPWVVEIKGGYVNDEGVYEYLDPQNFVNSKDVKEASEILKTFHY